MSNQSQMGTLYSLKIRNFRLLWLGALFSQLGQWVQQTTLSWLVYDRTGSGALLGTISGINAIPILILSPWVGVAADRFDRKYLMIVAQAPLLILTLMMGILLLLGIGSG